MLEDMFRRSPGNLGPPVTPRPAGVCLFTPEPTKLLMIMISIRSINIETLQIIFVNEKALSCLLLVQNWLHTNEIFPPLVYS